MAQTSGTEQLSTLQANTPIAGLIPRGGFEQFILAWAALNVVLTLLPLFSSIGNSAEMVMGFLPLTIFWSYSVFLSNVALGAVFFLFRARPWAYATRVEG